MSITITDIAASDIRFPTSLELDGSDAMTGRPDYSAAYAILRTDDPAGLAGHGLTFTIGRGNEVCVEAIHSLAPLVVGRTLDSIVEDFGRFWSEIAGDEQLRWLGPEKGVIHLATAAIVNAVWDLYAKAQGLPPLETPGRHAIRGARPLHSVSLYQRPTDARRGTGHPSPSRTDAGLA